MMKRAPTFNGARDWRRVHGPCRGYLRQAHAAKAIQRGQTAGWLSIRICVAASTRMAGRKANFLVATDRGREVAADLGKGGGYVADCQGDRLASDIRRNRGPCEMWVCTQHEAESLTLANPKDTQRTCPPWVAALALRRERASGSCIGMRCGRVRRRCCSFQAPPAKRRQRVRGSVCVVHRRARRTAAPLHSCTACAHFQRNFEKRDRRGASAQIKLVASIGSSALCTRPVSSHGCIDAPPRSHDARGQPCPC